MVMVMGGCKNCHKDCLLQSNFFWLLSTSGPFNISSLKIRRGKTSITAVWVRREWPCLFPLPSAEDDEDVESQQQHQQQLRVEICAEKEVSTCFKPEGKIRSVDERLTVTFQGLLPCTDYYVRHTFFLFTVLLASFSVTPLWWGPYCYYSLFLSWPVYTFIAITTP